MSDFASIHRFDESGSLTFACGDLPADEAIARAGHEANGTFWENMLQYLAPGLALRVEVDPEAGMFTAYGDAGVLEQIRSLIDPYLEDGERVAATIREAESAGFQFDD